MSILDTRDLAEKRDELKQQILDDFNEKFNQDLSDYSEIDSFLDNFEYETDDQNGFLEYWADETEQIEEIDNVESEVGNEFTYRCTLIDEDDFEEYCEDLVKDIGDLPQNLPSYIENNIDWSGVADDLKMDYSTVEYQGTTYLYR